MCENIECVLEVVLVVDVDICISVSVLFVIIKDIEV